MRKAGRKLLVFRRVIFTGIVVPANISEGRSMLNVNREILALPKKPETAIKLRSMDTMIKIKLLFVLAAATPRKIVKAM